ncbi:MAG: NUDIX domain-containing protein [Candidatus Peribacteria bacterium]|jgi:8-oxo-dGTP diphosphatase|nr:NUDIX domain-containing protein [Candidatus Peribacteria bacterium]
MNEISFPNYPRIGVGTIIRKEGKVLLGQRSAVGETGEGKWAFPGGRLEFYEDLIDCAKRETLEET